MTVVARGVFSVVAAMKRSGNDLETLDVAQSMPRVDEDVEDAGAAYAVEPTSVIGLLRDGEGPASLAFFIKEQRRYIFAFEEDDHVERCTNHGDIAS